MGRDKAMLVLGGRTLLGRVVDCLRQVTLLQDGDGRVVVTVAGERLELEGANRSIVDRYVGCGPMGGMEAALRDLEETDAADWAFFLPVDMPLVPPSAIDALLTMWIEAARDGAMVCHAVVDGRQHPLLSMVHRRLHRYLVEALKAGQYKVMPVLTSGGASAATLGSVGETIKGGAGVVGTEVCGDELGLWIDAGAVAAAGDRARRMWFGNLNTREDFSEAETFLAGTGLFP